MELNVKLECHNCGKEFERLAKEHRRNTKMNRLSFCGISCAVKHDNKINPRPGNPKILNIYISKPQVDNLSPFRYYLKNCKMHKQYQTDITLEYLKELWEKQNGICPYTNIKMNLPRGNSYRAYSKIKGCNAASLDRINSDMGYIRGNVEFVCYSINMAKNKFSKQAMINFIQEICNTNFNAGQRSGNSTGS